MPLYDYVCTNGHRTEVMHGVHDTGPDTCPTCGAPMRKAFVAPAIVFKGSGWAKVDRRTSSHGTKTTTEGATGTGKGEDGATSPGSANGSGMSGGAGSSNGTGSRDGTGSSKGAGSSESSASTGSSSPTSGSRAAGTD